MTQQRQTANESLPKKFSVDDEHRKLSHDAFKAGMKFLAESLGLIDSNGETEIPPNQIAAYEIILRDIPNDAFRWAVYELASSHRYPKLPTAGEIRARAVEYIIGFEPPALVVWNEALHYLKERRKFWNEFDGWKSKELQHKFETFISEQMDPDVRRIIELIGWKDLKKSEKQFVTLLEESRELKRERLMKPAGYSQAQQKRISKKGKELSDESKAT